MDQFLNYWLITRTADQVQSHEVFPRFRAFVEGGKAVADVAADLRHVGSTYQALDDIDPYSREGMFLYRWRTVDAGTTTPVLLWLFSQPPAVVSAEDRLRCLDAIESFLIRRTVCRMTTKDYILDLPLYRLLTRGRLRMVLEAIEDALRTINWPRG